MPVLRDGEVVGVVARSDVLRALEEPHGEEAAGEAVRIADRLDALEHLRPVFEAVQAVSEHFEGVYLVGGAVRDVLMGEPNFDVDIAVEGDGIAFGEALAEALSGRVVPHDRFGTAIVVHGGGRVDVAPPGRSSTTARARCRQSSRLRSARTSTAATSRSTRWPRPDGRGLRPARRPLRRSPGPGERRRPRAAQPVLHRRPDADLPGDPLREPLRPGRWTPMPALARACVEMNLVGSSPRRVSGTSCRPSFPRSV